MTPFLRHILTAVLFLAFLPMAGLCQTQTLFPEWFNDIGGSAGTAAANAVKIDGSGNVYVTGSFTGTVDFNPSAATANLTSASGNSGFIAKYKADGTFIWAYALAGTDVQPNGLTISSDGSLTIVGRFLNDMDADPGAGTNTLTASSGNDAFITHLNSNGGFLWAKTIGGSGEDIANKVATDGNNIYAVLQFQNTVTVGANSYTAKGDTDGMLVKYDLQGNVVYVVNFGFAGKTNTASDVAVDRDGNINVIGFSNGPANLNPLGANYALSQPQNAIYVAQYASNGTWNWAKDVEQGFPNTALSNNNNLNITVDGQNNIYIAAAFTGSAQFNAASSGPTINAKGNTDVLVARYSPTGVLSLYKNIGRSGGAVVPTGICVTTDDKGFYLTGYFTGTIDFSTNAAPTTVSYHGQKDLFFARYNATDFTLATEFTVGNNACANTQSNAISMTADNKLLATGVFCSNGDFGGTCTMFNESARGSSDMFLIKYSEPLPIANNIVSNPADCGGAAGTLKGSIPTGGLGAGSYTYQWQSSTDDNHFFEIGTPDSYGVDYTPPVTAGTVYYTRKVTSGCASPSYSISVTVGGTNNGAIANNTIDPTGILSGCGGAGATSLNGSLPTGGGGRYIYQWQESTNQVLWTNIKEGPYTTPTSQNLGAISYNNSFFIRRIVTIPGCSTPSTSPVATFTAVPRIDSLDIRATGATEFCDSGDPGTLTGKRTPIGGNGVYTYQWQSTTAKDNLFKDIDGATGPDYSPGVLTETTYFKRNVGSGPCITGDIGNNSNPINIFVKKLVPLNGNTIRQPNPDGELCLASADPSLITGDQPSGGSGYFIYQWQSSTDGINFVNINNSEATQKDYNPTKINATTYYRRVVTFTGESVCMTPNVSNAVKISVQTANVQNNSISQLDPDLPLICQIPADPKKITGSNATGSGFTYQWQSSTDGVNFTDITGVTTKDYDPAEISQSTSYRRAAVVPGVCAAPLYSNILTINVSPTASANTITAPPTTVFCDIGKADVIKGSVVTGNGVHYQWQSSTDSITFSDITNDPGSVNYPDYAPPTLTSTVYYRRTVSTAVCNIPSISKVVAIKIFQTPVVKLSADSVYICFGDNVTLTASGGTQYKWSPSDGLSSTDLASLKASPKTTTTYIVTVSNGGSCSVTGLIKVIVVPKATVNAGPDTRIFRGESVSLQGKVTGEGVHYSWSPSDYLDNPNVLTPVATPPKTTTYTLTATTDHGCSIITDEVKINVYERVIIPTGFTPNSDGKNDLWEIPALSSYPGSILSVYSRSGAEVFRTISNAKTWDGTYQGQSLPFGTYYYVIDLKDGTKPLSGWVTLIR